jgi:hypothetical protein
MAAYEDLISDIRADAHQAPDFVILKNIQAVGTEFFTRTGAWEQRLDDVRLRDGMASYQLSGEPGTMVIRIQEVWMQNTKLEHQAPRDVMTLRPVEGLPKRFYHQGGDLNVWPVPGENDKGESLRVLALLAPLTSTTQIPDHLFNQWRDALIYGTKARMLESPTQPWSNPKASAHFRDLYDRELRRAKTQAITTGAPLRVKSQPF